MISNWISHNSCICYNNFCEGNIVVEGNIVEMEIVVCESWLNFLFLFLSIWLDLNVSFL